MYRHALFSGLRLLKGAVLLCECLQFSSHSGLQTIFTPSINENAAGSNFSFCFPHRKKSFLKGKDAA
jgi:hypothetical protein